MTRTEFYAGTVCAVLLWVGCGVAEPAAAADTNGFGRALVRVTATVQESDASLPWQKKAPFVRQGYGILVGESRVLTTESLIRNQTLVELQYARTGERIPATVELADCQVDLALLRVKPSPAGSAGAASAPLAESVVPNAKLDLIQFDETMEIQKGSAQIVKTTMATLPAAPYQTLLYTLLTDINVNGTGAAVVQDGRLAGVMLSYDRSTRTGSMLPAGTIRHFVADAAEPPYKGFAYAGFVWQPLVDPAKRAFLNATPDGQGILVISPMPGTGAYSTLTNDDVIVKWDGRAIDNLGFYDDADLGRMSVAYLIQGRREPGEAVPLTIIRDRKTLQVTVTLSRRDEATSLIPEDVTGDPPPPYLVDGGLIIRELTGRYLRGRGGEWIRNVDSRIAHLYMTRQHAPEQVGDRVLVLVGVLPDPINIDFQEMRDEVILSVNGQPVRNMKDVFRVLGPSGHVTRLETQGSGIDVVMDAQQIEAANARLAKLYRLPALRYPPADGGSK